MRGVVVRVCMSAVPSSDKLFLKMNAYCSLDWERYRAKSVAGE